MASRLPVDVQDAFYRVVHDFAGGEASGGGVPSLARKMGMPPGTLYNKANPNESSHHKPTLADAVLASILTADRRIAHAFCHTLGGVFVDLPDLAGLTTDGLLEHLTKIGRESGEFYACLDASLRTDRQINAEEFSALEHEAEQWIAAIWEAVARLREMSGGA